MLHALSSPTPNHALVDPYIKQWLEQRQTVLVLYSQLSQATKIKAEKMATFCQTLVDYLSLGHFNVYEKLIAHHENVPSAPHQDLLEKISNTTDHALDFNEKYTEVSTWHGVGPDLSRLGEQLAHRMDLEDQLMKPYLKVFV
jgi:regulator of sigma D